MMDCWKKCAETRPNFNSVHSTVFDIHNKYAAIQSTVPSTGHGLNDTNYSTFGKDLRPQTSVDSVAALGYPHHRRKKSACSQRNSSFSRGSPMSQRNSAFSRGSPLSQRNSQNFMGLESTSQGDGLSITFSVLSDDNFLDQSSESEKEELDEKELGINMPMFLNKNSEAELYPSPVHTDIERYPRDDFPMESVSTFLTGPKAPRSSFDQMDLPSGTSSFHPPPAASGRHHIDPFQPPPINSPDGTASSMNHSQCATPTNVSPGESLEPREASDLPPRPLSSDSPNLESPTTPSILIARNDGDTVSKVSTLDSITTFVSGPHSNPPSSHIPGIPASTYNSTSVSIDDVKLRNKSFLSANGQTIISASSSTPSGTSKSDSGIRSDEEADLMLSNGCQPPPHPPEVAPKRSSMGNKSSLVRTASRKESEVSLGISDLSSDLMSAFASWGKN